jgi:hypothetical protein
MLKPSAGGRCSPGSAPTVTPRGCGGKTVGDVYEVIANFMPEPNPGSMTAEEVRDVIAHILKSNDLPAGMTELPSTLEELRDIRMERPPAP